MLIKGGTLKMDKISQMMFPYVPAPHSIFQAHQN